MEFDEKQLKPDFPKRVMLEVSGLCNHRCIFCSNRKSKRNKRVINNELAVRMIKEAYDGGAREISFHAMGEPLICKELKDYVKLSRELGYEYIYIDTNGALASPDVINPIVDAGLDSIKFSISAANKEDYLKVQGRDDFDKVLRNLKALSEYRKAANSNIKIIVGFVETIYTKGQFQQLEKLVEDWVDEIWFSGCATQGGTMADENEKIKIENDAEKYLCKEPFNRIAINCEGLIYACCMWDDSNDLCYGDANTESLKSAWVSEKAIDIRRQHLSGERMNNSCNKCGVYKFFESGKDNM